MQFGNNWKFKKLITIKLQKTQSNTYISFINAHRIGTIHLGCNFASSYRQTTSIQGVFYKSKSN